MNNKVELYNNRIIPLRKYSQNFLIDKNISKKIVDSLQFNDNDTILEIGPGTGALTAQLLKTKCNIVAVEIDKRAIALLIEKFPKNLYPDFNLIEGDIRDFSLAGLISKKNQDSKLKIIGNLPYSVSSDIFFWLFDNSEFIDLAVIMVQKEVGERLTAKTRTKSYGILTISAGLKCWVKKLFDVPPNCFYPKPDVMSSIIEMKFSNIDSVSNDKFKAIMKIVKMAFNQRRKMLKNSLSSILKKDEVNIKSFENNKSLEPFLSKRPEELTDRDFIFLTDILFGSI